MNKSLKYILLGTVFSVCSSIGVAQATEGMFPNASGARHKAIAGAGVADGQDATSINPAALARLDSQVQFSVSLFNPQRSTTFPPGNVPPVTFESESEYFAIPNFALNYRINSAYVDALGFSVIGTGGMNTDYQAPILSQAPTTGINLEQMLIGVTLAKKFGNISLGITPTLARQTFEGRGIYNPIAQQMAATGQQDVSWGYGVRGGIEMAVSPQFRLGLTGSTKMYMQKFDEFALLFPNGGELDIPANLQVGVAYDATPALTFMADYRYIFNSDVDAIGLSPASGGFGWEDVQTFKVGVEYDYSDVWTLRAGYAYNTQPIQSKYVQINQVAPGTVQHHFTAGFKKANFLMDGLDLEVAGMYAPNKEVSGLGFDANGNAYPIDIAMKQYEVTAGLSWKF